MVAVYEWPPYVKLTLLLLEPITKFDDTCSTDAVTPILALLIAVAIPDRELLAELTAMVADFEPFCICKFSEGASTVKSATGPVCDPKLMESMLCALAMLSICTGVEPVAGVPEAVAVK